MLNHERIYILIDKNKRTWRQIPLKNERNEIVEKAHLLGHVNAEAMRRNIRLKYYWKTLENECKRFATNS